MLNAALHYAGFVLFAAAIAAAVVIVRVIVTWLLRHTEIGARDYSEMDPETLVPIAHFGNAYQAQDGRNRLVRSGIRCLIIEEQQSYFKGGRGFGLSPHIEVRAADAERALEILSEND